MLVRRTAHRALMDSLCPFMSAAATAARLANTNSAKYRRARPWYAMLLLLLLLAGGRALETSIFWRGRRRRLVGANYGQLFAGASEAPL